MREDPQGRGHFALGQRLRVILRDGFSFREDVAGIRKLPPVRPEPTAWHADAKGGAPPW